MKAALALITISIIPFLLDAPAVRALDPSLDISQYAHTAWTVRDGFSLGNIYAIAQTPDGYLWLGGEFGLFRFDGVNSVRWPPATGQQLPETNINALLVTRDGTLWIGTFAGLATLSGGKLTLRPELGRHFIASLFEDGEGGLWAGTLDDPPRANQLCRLQSGPTLCYGADGAFGRAVWALYQDSSGTLWAAAESGLWRMKPGPPKRYPTATELIGLNKGGDGRLLIAMHGAGLLQLVGEKIESYPIRGGANSNRLLRDRDVDANRLLRDRDGGLWIGTVGRGLIHVHNGRTDVFTKSDGLSGDVILSLFEDREGNVWVASTGGLDRFRELPVATVSVKQGLSSDATYSVLATTDGSIWVGTHDGLTRYRNGQTTIFRKKSGLSDDEVQSLFQDIRGRIWASTRQGLAYFKDDRFAVVDAAPGGKVHSIAGDKAGNLFFSEDHSLLHLLDERVVERIPWSQLGHRQNASVLLAGGEQGALWLGFWFEGGVLYLKDRRLFASYTAADGLGDGPVQNLQVDHDGALWVATRAGLSRVKDGRIATLKSSGGLRCDTINWSIEDDDRSLWLYTACGLLRITRSEIQAWIADPNRRVETTVWDAGDGVRIRSSAASEYGPRIAKSTDGKLWFVTGDAVQVIDPHHLAHNKLPPPVHIEQIIANHKSYWQNLPSPTISKLRLPPRIRDLTIDYTGLSLVAPEKVRFKYKLEGQDHDWKEAVNMRQAQYTNLSPGNYKFHVMASNNSGVWSERGDTLEFFIPPAYYQTNWFRALCSAAFLLFLWASYRYRVRRLQHEFEMTLDARVGERTRIARDLHDTLLQSFHGVLLRLQTVTYLLQERPLEAQQTLDSTIEQVAQSITEGRDAVQGLRDSTIQRNDLAAAISTLGEELETASTDHRPAFRVAVEGKPHNLHPIVRDEVYKIAAEAMRNAFRHGRPKRVEVEIRYDKEEFRLRVRDDGKGISRTVLSSDGAEGHYGLRGMRERALIVGGKLVVWSEVDAGTEVELCVPAAKVYATAQSGSWLSRKFAGKAKA
jgi:signal transduction histidine kinase/ligand-binding sensor domain-containing protein